MHRSRLLGVTLATVFLRASLAQQPPVACGQSGVGPVAPASAGLNYLASIIPTPGLTSSSVCGTTGVRCAADASKAATGQGERLNEVVRGGNANAGAPYSEVVFVPPVIGAPAGVTMPLGEPVPDYPNQLCTGLVPTVSQFAAGRSGAESAAAAGLVLPAITGAQDGSALFLNNGGLLLAWMTLDASIV